MLRSPLEKPPELYDLLNRVAAEIPVKWKLVGVQLKLKIASLDNIYVNHQDYGRPTPGLPSLMLSENPSLERWY